MATDGIEVSSVQVDPGKKLTFSEVRRSRPRGCFNSPVQGDPKRLEFSLWDFAGQEVYYSTHQFFLNDRAIYIVCCNMEKRVRPGQARIQLMHTG